MLSPGTQLGRYTVREHLGAGGMGDVYLAVDPTLDRQVAVKVLPDALATDSDRLSRFVREAKAVSALNHPNILTVFDFGQDETAHYLVTEYVDGWTVREWSAEAHPPLVDLLDVMAQAASALAAAHAAGIVHRDVKPENVMVRRDGFVKVLDFGIAKLVDKSGADLGAITGPQLQTQPGTILGTTRYMSPEQALGTAVDARADIWSLGVVLYELVAGKAPFAAPTPMGTLALIVGREPEPLEAAAPDTPEAVCRIVAKALRKPIEERFATAAEMAGALERARQELLLGVTLVSEQDEPEPRRLAAAVPEPTAAPTNLPSRVSAIVGRERELDEVTALLRTPSVRLLTLTGPGGTGKTRLAVEAARLVLGEFADGVFAVDLSALSDPEQLAAPVAEVLGVKETPSRSLADGLAGLLAGKRLLLVLDNFEHLLAGAPFVSRLLAAAPGLTILATSRALLHVSQEREYAVEPLAVPRFTSLPSLDELERAPAVALFVERAREAKASFALTADNARAVVEVCQRLEGLPLALELAAARVKLLAPAAILTRLDDQLRLLTGGARDLPSRQQTMRGAVAWSYELLDEAERALVRRLAVFAGGATLEAAEAVCGSDGLDVLDAIGSAVDKSLLRQREQEDGEARFTMLEVVRAYALEQIEAAGEASATRLEHARYFARLAEEAAPKLGGAEEAAWVNRLGRERDNIDAALTVMFEREPGAGAAFAANLSSWWTFQSSFRRSHRWLAKALEADAVAPLVRARLLIGMSHSEGVFGRNERATAYASAAVEASRASGDERALVKALGTLGICLTEAGDFRGARETLEEGLTVARGLGGAVYAGSCLNNLGEVARLSGDLRAARAYYEQSLEAIGRRLSNYANTVALLNLGGVSIEEGDFAAAAGFYRESLAVAAELGASHSSALALDGLGAVALEAGAREQAARLAGAAEALYEAEAWSPTAGSGRCETGT